ncbi:phosphotransferase family protein [Paenibacillus sp. FSL R7-0331]|uniref:phosphotransferase family protein n=1 Tax=Paenibacillus sp. FSL R7-0331 TaxID=1536773 RepID=UPI0005A6EDEC|nr:aminoglycoside phosphotransferase family protein [Paenibacillus sp. FSL R7-0331]
MKGKQIGAGRTAEVREYGEGTIVKLYLEDFPAEPIRQEFKVSTYVYNQGGVSTPRPVGQVEAEGRSGIVFQQIHGRSLLSLISGQPWRLPVYARQLAALHHQLHQLEGSPEIGRHKELLERQIVAAPMLTMEEKTAVLEHLRPLPEGNRLCHGDFHPDNVLIDAEGAWIIDWMNGTSGNPAADAARSILLFSMGSMPPGSSLAARVVTGFIRQKLTKIYIREYLSLSGYSYTEIKAWILPVAAARLTEGVPAGEKENLAKEIRRRLSALRKHQISPGVHDK